MDDSQGRVLPMRRKPAPELQLLTFTVLLANGKTLKQRATDWSETTDDEGGGISYHFYAGKTRALTIEYSEVRAVLCDEHCDVAEALKALNSSPRKKKEA